MTINHAHNLTIQADVSDQGQRIDAFLAKKLAPYSRAQVTRLIKAGLVTCGGSPIKSSQMVVAHADFIVVIPKPAPSSLVPQNIALNILYSDEHIAVINKAKGMIVHPGAGVIDGTLCNALMYHFPDMNIGNEERPGIVHRLDKDTSGVMVVAKTHQAHQVLSDDFKERRVKKIYRAFCQGEIQKSRFSLITGHARHPHNRFKFSTKLETPQAGSSHVRLAHTDCVVLGRKFSITEVHCELHTGRTHQIRAHLADIGHPLLGDELYGGRRILSSSVPVELRNLVGQLQGQALYAEILEFAHPVTQEKLSFTAPLPEHMAALSMHLNPQHSM